jgi:hypothetical protein
LFPVIICYMFKALFSFESAIFSAIFRIRGNITL